MTTYLTPTTELDAVNLMLSTVGESPITSLEDGSSVDTSQARLMLANVSRQVQQRGWWFNTEDQYPLIPDNYSNQILVPANTMKITPEDPAIILRGNKLYHSTKHTYLFDSKILVEIVFLLPFEELPEPARNLITQRAGRMFQERMFGSDTLSNFTKTDESIALSDLVAADIEARAPSMLNDSQFAQKMTRRS